jgi:RNA 3'-terminal phosphate cyclase (ATP)
MPDDAVATAGPLRLDASHGEGGGQVLRPALALAVAVGRPVILERVRLRRPKPGLRPQHLAVVRALAAVGAAEVEGDRLGSTAVAFTPRGLHPGAWRFDIGAETGSAGSVALLFQALLPPLLRAAAPSRLTLIGGTHVPLSPTVSYLTDVFLPALAALGVRASVRLVRLGWYPAGGGEIEAAVEPAPALGGFTATSPPSPLAVTGRSIVSRLPVSIAERQRRRAEERLAAAGLHARIEVEEDHAAHGPGTAVCLACPARAGFAALGRRGVPAERVADDAVEALFGWRASGAAVDDHLADQLVPLLALAGTPSAFTCPDVSAHLETVAWVVERFLPVAVRFSRARPAGVEIRPAAALRSR